MSWRNITLLLAGVVLTGLGGLWFLQEQTWYTSARFCVLQTASL
jgi:hypothetical protein